MITPVLLTDQERKQLRLQARRSVGRIAECIQYVLLFSRGHTPARIAALYDLDDRPHSGRPRLATVVAQTEAKRCLEVSPTDTGAEQTVWTRRLLGRHLSERIDCDLSLSTLARLMDYLSFVWRRPKLTLKRSDPQQAERQFAYFHLQANHRKCSTHAAFWQSRTVFSMADRTFHRVQSV